MGARPGSTIEEEVQEQEEEEEEEREREEQETKSGVDKVEAYPQGEEDNEGKADEIKKEEEEEEEEEVVQMAAQEGE